MTTPHRSAPPVQLLPAAAVAAAVAAALIVLGASGGAFDVVTRQSAGLLAWWAAAVLALLLPRGAVAPGPAAVFTTACAAAMPVWITITIGDTLSTERTATELARAVVHLAPLVLLGWIMPARHWRMVIGGATAGALAIVAAGFAERLSPGLITTVPTVVFTNTADRLATPLGYWNAVGSWAVITLLLLLAVSSHAQSAPVRAAALLGAPMTIAVAYVTYSRSAIASALVALVVLLVLSRNRWSLAVHTLVVAAGAGAILSAIRGAPQIANATGSAGGGGILFMTIVAGIGAAAVGIITAHLRLDDRRMPVRSGRTTGLAVTALAALAIAAVGITKGGDLKSRFTDVNPDQTGASRLTEIGNGPRVSQWRATIDTWEAHRSAGTGAGTFEIDWNRSPRNDTSFVRDAHSAFLETLAEQGTIGFLLLVGFVAGAVVTVLTARRRVSASVDIGLVAGAGAGIAAFLTGSAFDWFWEVTALAALTLVLLGALMAATREHAEEPAGRRRPLPWRLGIAAICVVGALVQVPGLVGTSEVRRSQRAIAAGDLTGARSHADQAIDTMPWAGTPFLQRALVDERAGAFGAARKALHLAIERDPYDWRLPLVLARVEAKSGRVEAALKAYARAKSLRPKGQFFRDVRSGGPGA
jgi:O-Antigen ligase